VYDVRARKGEKISALVPAISLERGERKDVELTLVQGRFVQVLCTSEKPDFLPVPGASIVVSELGLSSFPLSLVSDAQGRARVGPLSQAPSFISVSAEGYVGRNALPIPETATEMRLELLHGATLEGRVVDAHGHAIMGAGIEIIGFDLDGLPIAESPELSGYRKAHFAFALTPLPLIPAGELGITRGHLPYVSEVNAATNWSSETERRPGWLSDIEGRFTAHPVPPGRVRALVRHPGYVEGLSETFELTPGQVESVTVILQDGGHLLGRVVDERGFPIAGARIQVTAPNASYERNLYTNDSGAFELTATPREINVALARPIDASRFVLQELVRVEAGADTEHEFVLVDPRGTLEWTIQNDAGEAVELAQVSLASLDPKVPLRVTRFSSVDGRVSIDDAVGLDVQVSVQAPGFVPVNEHLRAAPSERTITLQRGTRITGEVTAVRGHLAVMGAEIALETAVRRVTTLTDGQGRFDFGDVPRGRAVLTVRHAEYAPARLQIDVTDTGRTDRPLELEPIDLEEGASAEGVVVNSEGEPVAGARVSLGTPASHIARNTWGSGSTVTDEQGHFVLRGLPPGEHSLGALAPTRERGALSVALSPGEHLEDLEIELAAEAELDEIGSQSGGVAADFGDAEGQNGPVAQIRSVESGSEAERAGLRAGDVIVDVDGAPVASSREARARTTGRAGQDVIIGVDRDGERRAYRVRLETLRH
jgi:S1-C subfamily serine protease/protocatechuate 3,4-dioxygenase beta subunit